MTRISSPTLRGLAPAPSAQAAPATRRSALVHRNRTRSLWLLGSLILLAVAILASIAIGAKVIPFRDVIGALIDPSSSDNSRVIDDLRLPRTLLAVIVGVALGVAGALVQGITRNPLADPGILGVNAGASLFVVLGVVLLGFTSITQFIWLSLAGAILVATVVYAIGSGRREGTSPIKLTLAGVGIGAVISGLVSGLTLLNPRAFDNLRSWNAGSVSGLPMSTVTAIIPFVVVGLVLAAIVARDLNAVGLGDDLARSLGTKIWRTRILVIVAMTLLAGSATAAAGPITFVGLMVPHVAKWIVGADQRWIMALTCFLGPILVLTADIVGRVVLRPAELPVGIVTAFVGAPVLIVLARRLRVGTR